MCFSRAWPLPGTTVEEATEPPAVPNVVLFPLWSSLSYSLSFQILHYWLLVQILFSPNSVCMAKQWQFLLGLVFTFAAAWPHRAFTFLLSLRSISYASCMCSAVISWAPLCVKHCAPHGNPEWIREVVLDRSWVPVLKERQRSWPNKWDQCGNRARPQWLKNPEEWLLIQIGMGTGANAKHGKIWQVIDMRKQIVNLRITMWNARIIIRETSEYIRRLRGFLFYHKYRLQENSLTETEIPIYQTHLPNT